MADYFNPWDVVSKVHADQRAQAEAPIQQMAGHLGILSKLREMQAAESIKGILSSDLPPEQKQMELAKTPQGLQILQHLTTARNADITGQLNAARLGELNRNATVKNGEIQARDTLSNMLNPQAYNAAHPELTAPVVGTLPPQTPNFAPGTGNPDVKENPTPADLQAIAAFKAAGAENGQTPMSMIAPNKQAVQSLAIQAGSSLPRGVANSLLGNGANGQVMAPRVVQSADSPTGWGYLMGDGTVKQGAPAPASAAKAGYPNTPNSGAPLPADFNKTGDEFLQSLPKEDQTFVKKLANYEIDPKTLSTRGGEREKYLRMAAQLNPDFDQKNYNAISNAINRFSTGQQGNTVRSLNVAIEHMDTARKLGDALKNNDIPIINQLANEFATQTGKPAPTNFNAVKEIVADEVVKGVIGGAGALQDREAAAKKIRDSASPAQMNGVLNSWTELLGGQLKGLERQYEGATTRKDFRTRYLTPRALDALSGVSGQVKTEAVTGGVEFNGFKFPSQQKLDEYKKGGGYLMAVRPEDFGAVPIAKVRPEDFGAVAVDVPKTAQSAPETPVAQPSLSSDMLKGFMSAGPLGALMGGFGHGLGVVNDAVTSGAYQAGGKVTDMATAAGAPPNVAAGAGYATNVGLQAIPALAGGGVGKMAAPVFEAAGKRVMQSALKPTLKQQQLGNADRAVTTMLDEGVNVTRGGVEKLNNLISGLEDNVQSVLSKYPNATVDKGAVASRIQDVVTRIEKTNPTPQSALAEVNKVYDDFMTNGLIPKNISVADANRFKSGIYKTIKDSYGKLGSDTVEAQKALARGFKEEVSSAVPEISPMTAKQGDLINARNIAERRTLMEGNNNILGLAPLTHSPSAALSFLIDKYGLTKSLLARALYSGSEAIPTVGGAAAGGVLSQIPPKRQ